MTSPSIAALLDQYTNGSDYYSDDSELCRTHSEIPTPPNQAVIAAIDWHGALSVPSAEKKTYMTDEDRWRAVLARDTEADGAFLYLVKSTKIYCRPTCPSRRPLRQNVSFVESTAAIQRGYTACKRCLPDHMESASQRRQAQAIDDAQAFLLAAVAGGDKLPRLEDLAMHVGMSKFHFQRVFKKSVGMSPTEYARSLKLGHPLIAVVDAAASLPS